MLHHYNVSMLNKSMGAGAINVMTFPLKDTILTPVRVAEDWLIRLRFSRQVSRKSLDMTCSSFFCLPFYFNYFKPCEYMSSAIQSAILASSRYLWLVMWKRVGPSVETYHGMDVVIYKSR